MDKLIKMLRKSKLRCSIGRHYLGIMVYADDVILLSPSRMGLQAMMNICQRFAADHNLLFSTNPDPAKAKTKCIHFSKKNIDLAEIKLNGNKLPWVASANHVGNILERDNMFTKDIRVKRGSFIGRIHSLEQELYFANPVVKMRLISIYASSFYGSSLWNLFDGHCDRVYTAWNNCIRDVFKIPRTSHRYLVEELSEHLHPKVMLSSRFLKYHQTLQKSSKTSIRYLHQISSQNMMTTFAKNLSNIENCLEVVISRLSCDKLKNSMKYCTVPQDQTWRVALLKDLLELKWNTVEIDLVSEEVEDLDSVM